MTDLSPSLWIAPDNGRLPNLAHVGRDYLAKAVVKTMRMVEGRGRLRFSK